MLKNKFFIGCVGIALAGAIVYNVRFFTYRMRVTHLQDTSTTESGVASLSRNPEKGNHQENVTTTHHLIHKEIVNSVKDLSWEKRPWGRDPFLTPEEERTYPQRLYHQEEGEKTEATTIQGILIGQNQRIAIVDHAIVGEGDWIGEEQVVEINKDRIVLALGKNRRTLAMQSSPFTIAITEKKERGQENEL